MQQPVSDAAHLDGQEKRAHLSSSLLGTPTLSDSQLPSHTGQVFSGCTL
jgi:hypothetical protein